jgi:hypothetical protein
MNMKPPIERLARDPLRESNSYLLRLRLTPAHYAPAQARMRTHPPASARNVERFDGFQGARRKLFLMGFGEALVVESRIRARWAPGRLWGRTSAVRNMIELWAARSFALSAARS